MAMPMAAPPRIERDGLLDSLLSRYRKQGTPVRVDFRSLVQWPSYPERATHLIHPYPAKLLAHIPFFFLATGGLSKPGDTVLDPFCGSGTVLLESMLAGRNGLGADANPLARLITSVKTHRYRVTLLAGEVKQLLRSIPKRATIAPPDVINIDLWFYPHVIEQLLRILQVIQSVEGTARQFFDVCFSNCLKRVSLADPRLSVPVRLREDQYPKGHWLRVKTSQRIRRLRRVNVIKEFERVVSANLERVARLSNQHSNGAAVQVVSSDARRLIAERPGLVPNGAEVPGGSVQLVITSPPYAGAQKYVRAASLSLGWLGICPSSSLTSHEKQMIGREHFPKHSYAQALHTGIDSADEFLTDVRSRDPLRAHIAARYLMEMKEVFREIVRVMASGGFLVLVAGDNTISKRRFRTSRHLRAMLSELGLDLRLELVDHIKSRGLMTTRNNTAGLITREWVGVFRKL